MQFRLRTLLILLAVLPPLLWWIAADPLVVLGMLLNLFLPFIMYFVMVKTIKSPYDSAP
jgi:hypothetical protein